MDTPLSFPHALDPASPLIQAAWRFLIHPEDWMYMYSKPDGHYFKHVVTRQYQVVTLPTPRAAGGAR